MAEFKTIMTGWKDICDRSGNCYVCPIKECDECYYVLEKMNEDTIKSIEDAVLKETHVWKKHIDLNPLNAYYECSACGCRSTTQSRYCPDCGRKLLPR